jgi:hypothetical protein
LANITATADQKTDDRLVALDSGTFARQLSVLAFPVPEHSEHIDSL